MSKKVLEYIKSVLTHDRFLKHEDDNSDKPREPYKKPTPLKDHPKGK